MALAALLVLVTGSAQAQAPAFNWSGWYLGAFAGYGWRDENPYPPQSYYESLGLNFGGSYYTPAYFAPGGAGAGAGSAATYSYSLPEPSRHEGVVAGLTFGYNYQVGRIVLGGEYDFIYGQLADNPKYITTNFGVNGTTGAYTAGNFDPTDGDSNDWWGVFRGRVGVTMFDRWLVYATGGVVYRFAYSNSNPYVITPAGAFISYQGINKADAWGAVAGAGIEFALTQNVFVKAEYLHMFFEQATYLDPLASTAAGQPVVRKYDRDIDLVRVGVNYRFYAPTY